MNKRQAKKAFKKKYGYNPGEVIKALNDFSDQYKKTVPVIVETLKAGLNALSDQIKIVCNEYTKE